MLRRVCYRWSILSPKHVNSRTRLSRWFTVSPVTDPTEDYFRYQTAVESKGFAAVRGLGPKPTLRDFVKVVSDKRGDFETIELVTLLHKLCEFPASQLQELKKSHPKVIRDMMQSLKDNLTDQLEYEPFISDEFAKKMNSLSPEEYEAYLQETLDNPDPQATNFERKFPRIGEIARCLAVLRVNDFDVWELLLKFIEKDRYRTTMPETLSALEGIGFYYHVIHRAKQPNEIQLPERLREMCNKLETVIFKSVWYENMSTFTRIYRSLHLLGKYDNRQLFDKVEFYLMNTLDGNYTADEFIEVAHLIVKSGHGGRELFTNLQRIIAYGHYSRMSHPLLNMFKRTDPFTVTASNLCKISEIYQAAKQLFPGIEGQPDHLELMPDFKVGFFHNVKKFVALPQTDISLPQIETLFLGIHNFDLQLEEIAEYQEDLARKAVKVVSSSVDLSVLAVFTRNIADPFFHLSSRHEYKQLLSNKLKKLAESPSSSGLVGINPGSLSTFGNMYARSELATSEGLQALSQALRRYEKDNKYRLARGEGEGLLVLAAHIDQTQLTLTQPREQSNLQLSNTINTSD